MADTNKDIITIDNDELSTLLGVKDNKGVSKLLHAFYLTYTFDRAMEGKIRGECFYNRRTREIIIQDIYNPSSSQDVPATTIFHCDSQGALLARKVITAANKSHYYPKDNTLLDEATRTAIKEKLVNFKKPHTTSDQEEYDPNTTLDLIADVTPPNEAEEDDQGYLNIIADLIKTEEGLDGDEVAPHVTEIIERQLARLKIAALARKDGSINHDTTLATATISHQGKADFDRVHPFAEKISTNITPQEGLNALALFTKAFDTLGAKYRPSMTARLRAGFRRLLKYQ